MVKTRSKFVLAVFVSLTAHAGILSLILFVGGLSPEGAAGDKEYVISVDLMEGEGVGTANFTGIADDAAPDVAENSGEASPLKAPDLPYKAKPKKQKKEGGQQGDAVSSSSTGTGIETGGHSLAGSGGSNITLSKIKAKIEAAKLYPLLAKRMKLEGKPTVLFEINADGSVKYVQITNSSGEAVLDNAAIEAVKRAIPLPYYDKPIKLAIRYELTN